MINAQPADGIIHAATYELASANLESSVFANINEVNSPNPSPGPSNMRAAKLNGLYDSTRIGASILLRVMPEDQLELSALYYWEEDTVTHSTTTSQDMLGSLLGALTGGVGGYSGNEGPDGNLLNGLLNGRNYNTAFGAIKDEITDPNLPRAYLNYMVFDRNMNLVSEQSGAIQVGSVTGNWTMLEPDEPLTIGQDGYVLVSVENAWDMDVHFDQVKVTFYKGMIKQEQHYYPYGLAVNAAQDATIEPNQNKYQGKELQDELNVQLYDFHARQYDPQIGKFWGLDPLDQFPSGYTGMGNDPANMVDPTGMQTVAAGRAWALNPTLRWNSAFGVYVPGNVDLSGSIDHNPFKSLSTELERLMNEELEQSAEEKAYRRALLASAGDKIMSEVVIKGKRTSVIKKIWKWIKGINFEFGLGGEVTYGAALGVEASLGKKRIGTELNLTSIDVVKGDIDVVGGINSGLNGYADGNYYNKDGIVNVTQGAALNLGAAGVSIDRSFQGGSDHYYDNLNVEGHVGPFQMEKNNIPLDNSPAQSGYKPNHRAGLNISVGVKCLVGLKVRVRLGVSHD